MMCSSFKKMMLAVCMLLVSLSSFSMEMSMSGVEVAPTSFNQKMALQVVNDSQVYLQLGEASDFLKEEIAILQSQNHEMSSEDALDLLLTLSENMLINKSNTAINK